MTERVNLKAAEGVEHDAEIHAVRILMADSERDARPLSTDAVRQAPAAKAGHFHRSGRRDDKAAQLPELACSAEELPEKKSGTLRHFACAAANAGIENIRSYRPESRRILRTSLILMLLLKPFFVFGWAFAGIAAVVIYYLSVGGDAFWRQVLSVYGWVQTRFPDIARSIRLRAFIIGRRWDRILLELPFGLADRFHSPDLRQMMVADARHDAALTDRLSRLYD